LKVVLREESSRRWRQAAVAGEGADAVGIGFGHDGQVDGAGDVRGGAVERVEDRRAGRTRRLRERQPGGLPARRPGRRVARVAREHEAVDHERVLARLEEFGQAHLTPVAGRLLEAVVLRDRAAGRQRAALGRDALDRAPELHLGLEQAVAVPAVLAGLAREADAGVHRHRVESTPGLR
jgi:hypothetical protein